jgi:nucleoid DNA-binding protein
MDKPFEMPVKEYLMRVQSVKTNTPLKTIEAVVDYQMQGANSALENNESVELSGFGKFIFNAKKAKKKYYRFLEKKKFFEEAFNSPTLSDVQRRSYERLYKGLIGWLDDMKPKIEEYERSTDCGGMEKQAGPCSRYEESDRAHFPGEEESVPELPLQLGSEEGKV